MLVSFPEGEGWDRGAFRVKSKAPLSKSSPSGEDFKAKAFRKGSHDAAFFLLEFKIRILRSWMIALYISKSDLVLFFYDV